MTTNDILKIHKGSYYTSNSIKSNIKKVLVFDLDETIGSFTELNILFNTIQDILQNDNILSIHNLLDLYPEFFRNNIFQILQYVYKKKKIGECHKIYIYTNNQSKSQNVSNIVEYITNKIVQENEKLFDQIIYAFKINGQIVQVGRTTHNKTQDDLLRCTLLPKKTAICYLDDYYFDEMNKEQIYYLQPKAYFHGLSSYNILQRLFNSKYGHLLSSHKRLIEDHYFARCIKNDSFLKRNIRTDKTIEENDDITKKMLYHVRNFFLILRKKTKTMKQKKQVGSFTRKKRF